MKRQCRRGRKGEGGRTVRREALGLAVDERAERARVLPAKPLL